MSRQKIIGVLTLVLLLGVGLCAAVLTVGLILSAPRSVAVGPPPPSLPTAEIVEIPSSSGSAVHGWWVPGTIPGGGEWLLPPILGVEPTELRPIDRIKSATAPILVLSGSEDDRTPLTEARALFDAAQEPKLFVAVPGGAC